MKVEQRKIRPYRPGGGATSRLQLRIFRPPVASGHGSNGGRLG
jgi:hypothetical protein